MLTTYPYPTCAFNAVTDIDTALKDNDIKVKVKDNEENFCRINIAQAMTHLTQVGPLLQIALAGSKGHSCSKPITEIIVNYQHLVGNTLVTCGAFVSSCLAALRSHKLALTLANKQKMPKALDLIKSCGDLANAMEIKSQELVEESTKLWELSKNGLLTATENSVMTIEARQKVKQMINELNESQAALMQQTADLAAEIEEEKLREEKADREAQDAREKAFIIGLTSAIAQPVASLAGVAIKQGMASDPGSAGLSIANGLMQELEKNKTKKEEQKKTLTTELTELEKNLAKKTEELKTSKNKDTVNQEIAGLNSEIEGKKKSIQDSSGAIKKIQDQLDNQAKAAENKAAAAAERRAKLSAEKRQANAELAKTVEKLKNTKVKKNNLEHSIQCLEVTIHTMGKVVTIFENVRIFWKGVHNHCQSLADTKGIELVADPDLIEEFSEQVKISGLSWLALGKINLTASRGIEAVKGSIDSIMNNIPDDNKALELVQTVSGTILKALEQEDKLLEQESK